MTSEEMQKFGQESMQNAYSSFGVWTKGAQVIATEVTDYSRKSIEEGVAAWERLLGSKSFEAAAQVQSEYLKASYEGFVAEATKLSELYADFGKEAYKPFQNVFGKAMTT
jgi:phasin family protein